MDGHAACCSVPDDSLGDAGDLLLESALGMDARSTSVGICLVLGLGVVGNATSETAKVVRGCVRGDRGLVDLYPPFPRSSLATRGVGNAPGNNR